MEIFNYFIPGKQAEANNTSNSLALLALRLTVAISMIVAHGWAKFQSLLAGSTSFPDPLAIGPFLSLSLAVFAEFFCSILILIGFANRLATVPLMITMLVAAFISNAGETWVHKEKAFLFFIIYLALLIMGSGKYSIDSFINKRAKQ